MFTVKFVVTVKLTNARAIVFEYFKKIIKV